ncbi:MAG: hypothetical protein ACFFDT_08050 [Candidatus Hodarchaeota archaeon]
MDRKELEELVTKLVKSAMRGKKQLDDAIDESVAEGFLAFAKPRGEEIDPQSHIHPDYLMLSPHMLEMEKRLNECIGVLPIINKPIYSKYTRYSEMDLRYMRRTPGIHGKRAELTVEALKQGALQRQPDMSHQLPFSPQQEFKVEEKKERSRF